jgi:hypothetical protein
MTTVQVTPTIETFDQKFHTLTDKYKLAKTRDIVDRIVSLGFTLDKFVANKTRKKERQGFQKHRAIFTSPLMKATADGIPQLLLTNSHDGTSCIELRLGFFRMVCANGLVIGTSLVPEIRLRHTGADLDDRLIAAIDNIVAQAPKLTDSIDKMKSTILTQAEITAFQREALQKRLGDAKIESFSVPSHRVEDNASDLFTVMNVVQENLIRGGARVLVEQDGKRKDKAIRRVNSLITQTEINTMLWDLAEKRLVA